MSLTSPINDITLVWDEVSDPRFDRYEIWRAPFLPIIAVDTGTKRFTFAGMLESWFVPGETVQVTGSPGNDNYYTISTVTQTGGVTHIVVLETVPNPNPGGYIGNALINQLAGSSSKGYYKDRDMPVGFYYYVIYAVDKEENYSDPTDMIQKFSPQASNPPATPTGLVGRRTAAYNAVEIYWNETEAHDLKGYVVRRTLNPYDVTPTWETIALTGSNKFKDSDIPKNQDATYQRTDVAYYIEAYDKVGNISLPTAATPIFEIPVITGVRVSLDYLSLNIYWDDPMPEDGVHAVAVLLRLKGSNTWTFIGASEWPKNFFRISQELALNTDYELVLAIVKTGVHPIVEHDNPGVVGRFKITGDYTTAFPVAQQLVIYDSANLNGIYTISSRSYVAPNTVIETTGAVPAEYTINGINLVKNYVQISGNQLANFLNKKVFISIFGSTGNNGRYQVVSADLYQGQTRLFVQEPLKSAVAAGNVTSGTIANLTELLNTIQIPVQLVPIPNYETDTQEPTPPQLLTTQMDPENRRALLNWTRIAIEDDFLEFHVEMNLLGGDFPITLADQSTDYFRVAGDQTAYFYVYAANPQKIRIYDSTGNDGWYNVTNVVLSAGNTLIYIDDQVASSTADGKIESDLAWFVLDKTKNTNFQAYFPYILNPGSPNTYWFRVRAVDRSGNKSLPESCMNSVIWRNPDLNGIVTPTLVPQWIDYTETYYSSFQGTFMRRYALTVNGGSAFSKYFKRFVIFGIQHTATATPVIFFSLTPNEIIAMETRNTFDWDTIQDNPADPTPETIYLWPAIEDIFGEVWMGPVSSIIGIAPTATPP